MNMQMSLINLGTGGFGRTAFITLLASLGALAGGCATSGPSGAGGGITSASDRTPGMYKAPEAETTQLLQFADQVSESISARIGSIPAITGAPAKVVIVLGNIENTTRTPNRDFATIRRRIFMKMVNSNVKQHADIIEDLSKMDALNQHYGQPATVDRLDEGTGSPPAQAARYNRDYTFVLNGTFGELLRGDVSTYISDFSLTQLSSGRIEFAEQYEFKQERR